MLAHTRSGTPSSSSRRAATDHRSRECSHRQTVGSTQRQRRRPSMPCPPTFGREALAYQSGSAPSCPTPPPWMCARRRTVKASAGRRRGERMYVVDDGRPQRVLRPGAAALETRELLRSSRWPGDSGRGGGGDCRKIVCRRHSAVSLFPTDGVVRDRT